MRTSFIIGLGLLVCSGGSARPQVKPNEISQAGTILQEATIVAQTIPDDPPKPPEVLRISYLDLLYGPEKREHAIGAIAHAKAGEVAGVPETAKTTGAAKANAAQQLQALLAAAVTENKSGDHAGARNTFEQAMALVSADSSLKSDRTTLGSIAQAQAEMGQYKRPGERPASYGPLACLAPLFAGRGVRHFDAATCL
jgi:hypothetical protein